MPEFLPNDYDVIVGFEARQFGADFDIFVKQVHDTMADLKNQGAVKAATMIFRRGKHGAALGALLLDPQKLTLAQLQEELPTWNKKGVAWFEANAGLALTDCPPGSEDPLRRDQWALDRLGVTGTWDDVPTPMDKTLVAIVDSGLRRPDGSLPEDIGDTLPVNQCQPAFEFDGMLWTMFPDGVDMNGHGTMLAGTIAAVPCNGLGVASAVPVDWKIVLMPIKFFGAAQSPTILGATIAIYWAAAMGARVINASWHVAYGQGGVLSVQSAMQWATLVGAVVVAAAGNDGTDNGTYPTYPANYGHGVMTMPGLSILTVAATDRDDWKSGFSNYSPALVDIAAPGRDIVTTGAYWIGAARYPDYSGTSAAAAFASSAAALVAALNPTWGPIEVIQHLKDSSDKLASLALVCNDGNRLNICRAVEGPLVLTAPAAGATLQVGQTTKIRWANAYKSARFDKVRIELSRDDGATWPVTLKASTANDGKWNWKPTAAQKTQKGRIRVTPLAGNFPKVSGTFKVV
ncbi:MAG: S8 family serine peptidase [Reyranella sp.]|uniref:S8 family serine peptidase n=1 Tax=Reyranella sp. TaxID=1929291 RepID=UPI001AC41235|nr:S8 family serine peptidase [Reyranella sp.]MBN9087366.1 S8 family serine peptidase [Reyranella sp.]